MLTMIASAHQSVYIDSIKTDPNPPYYKYVDDFMNGWATFDVIVHIENPPVGGSVDFYRSDNKMLWSVTSSIDKNGYSRGGTYSFTKIFTGYTEYPLINIDVRDSKGNIACSAKEVIDIKQANEISEFPSIIMPAIVILGNNSL
jgi:hypothetical protein